MLMIAIAVNPLAVLLFSLLGEINHDAQHHATQEYLPKFRNWPPPPAMLLGMDAAAVAAATAVWNPEAGAAKPEIPDIAIISRRYCSLPIELSSKDVADGIAVLPEEERWLKLCTPGAPTAIVFGMNDGLLLDTAGGRSRNIPAADNAAASGVLERSWWLPDERIEDDESPPSRQPRSASMVLLLAPILPAPAPPAPFPPSPPRPAASLVGG
mmetsp:Transcript_2859/g.8013  ORF Transcript_2859/g.8013 Transcript_2859/m.8013 type:complete len:212 (-) Transcript_2859:1396-2031(-)